MDGKATAFYDNVATLPTTDKSVFIRPTPRVKTAKASARSSASSAPVKAGHVYSTTTRWRVLGRLN